MNQLELIINKYATAIVNYHMALDEDYKKANKYFSQAEKHLCELKLIENWIEDFQHLLDHENVSVRINAATALLPYEIKLAKKCLKRCCLLLKWYTRKVNRLQISSLLYLTRCLLTMHPCIRKQVRFWTE